MKDRYNTSIILTGSFLVVILFVMCYLSIKAGAADIIKSRSPINIHHKAWVCVADTEPNAPKALKPDPDEVEWLAIAIYNEAGSDSISDETRRMVGDVILNRVDDDRFPDTIYDVLTQRAQYGRFYWTGIVWPSRAQNASEANAVSRARDIATDLLKGNHSRLYGEGYIWQSEHKQSKDSFKQDGIWFGR